MTIVAFAPAAVAEPGENAAAVFAKPVVLRGTLGDASIQMQLRPKEEFEGGVEGQYFAFGQSGHVLVAGEVDGDEVFMEESVNGRDVSGDWAGRFHDGVFSGEWQGMQGEVRPFRLEILRINKEKQK
ncbi:MAG TPA: hypothetical protein VM406_05890 [Noviherbaspirillum sp.]|nr:hypothetical protein [Noviherbaspirillum sp.]